VRYEDHDSQLLARLDERVQAIQKELHMMVTRVEFWPVKIIAFGLAGLILSAVIAAVIAQVLVK
jgi:hypothetical protein